MKTVSLIICDKDSDGILNRTVVVSDNSVPDKPVVAEKERIKNRVEEIFSEVPFARWYYEAETFDDLTEEELKIFEELDIEII